jgi:DNA end-binding protein Ku
MVILTDEDFADLPLTTSRAIDVMEFVPADQIDPILFAKAYYLEPEGQAAKPYVLLRDALQDADRVAIVKIAMRQREQLATLRVHEGVLVLNTMLWPDEVRAPEFGFLDDDIETRPAELAMAQSLIDSMAGSFKADEFTDNYRAALQEVIDAKVEGREVVQPEEAEEEPSAAIDLMAALKASVERAKQARGESAPPAKKAAPAKKKAAAKKATPAKKAAKKSA